MSATENGTASRGNRTLRSRFSRSTSDRTEFVVTSMKNWNRTSAEEDVGAVVRDALAEVRELGEDDIDDSEERERARQGPHVAEHAAVEAEAPVGDGEHPREAPEPPEVVALECPLGSRSQPSRSSDFDRVRQIGDAARPALAVEDQRRQILSYVDGLVVSVRPRDGGGRRIAAGRKPVLELDPDAHLVAAGEVARWRCPPTASRSRRSCAGPGCAGSPRRRAAPAGRGTGRPCRSPAARPARAT